MSNIEQKRLSSRWLFIAAILGFLAVLLGAFGAHGIKLLLNVDDYLKAQNWWKTAVLYHFVHTFLLLFIAQLMRDTIHLKWLIYSARFTLWGLCIFSGSLYVMSLTGILWLGAITPIGGLFLLSGWLLLAVSVKVSK